MDVSSEEIREACPRFRVLIVGRRNAGKTTILEKMTGSEAGVKPEIRDERGWLVDDQALLTPGIERGMSNIEYEITYPNNPGFVFHDSRGIEAGAESDERSPLRIQYIRSFIERRAMEKKLANQLHAIWFCIPMDNPRVPSDSFELAFFNLGTGAVPVVAVLTKYEAFLDRAKSTLKERQGHEPNKKQILSYLDEQVMSNIEKTKYPPAATVQTHHKGEGCNILTEKTYAAIKDQTLAHIFALSQENSMRVSCEETFNSLSRPSILKARQSATHFAYNALVSFPFWRHDLQQDWWLDRTLRDWWLLNERDDRLDEEDRRLLLNEDRRDRVSAAWALNFRGSACRCRRRCCLEHRMKIDEIDEIDDEIMIFFPEMIHYLKCGIELPRPQSHLLSRNGFALPQSLFAPTIFCNHHSLTGEVALSFLTRQCQCSYTICFPYVLRLSFTTTLLPSCIPVALLLACWTSKKSKTPSAYLALSIAHLDAMVNERTRFTNGVDQILKQHSGNHDILLKELAQHVINNADTFIKLETTLPSHNDVLGNRVM